MEDGKLIFTLILRRHERSKDTNGSTTEITIENRNIIFKEAYHGFQKIDGRQFQKEISPEEEDKLIEYLKKLSLNKSISETKDTNGTGLEKKLSIEISKPFKCNIYIAGKSNIWGSDDFVMLEWGEKYVKSRTNIENAEIISNAESFISLITLLHNS